MGLFQHSVLNKYLNEADQTEMKAAYQKLTDYFHNPISKRNIIKTLNFFLEVERKAYFNEQKQKAQSLKSEIDKTDREIDRMVYELYRLTEEEIGIVEGN